LKANNQKELDYLKRKFEVQKQEKEVNLKNQLKRDFDFEVRRLAEELSQKREKDVVRKYKTMYEREKKQLEERLLAEFNANMKEVKA
jgi:hypothetical protein